MGNVKKCVPYSPQTKRCLLCLNEKLEIAAYKEQNLLNKRNEIVYCLQTFFYCNNYTMCLFTLKIKYCPKPSKTLNETSLGDPGKTFFVKNLKVSKTS